MTALTALTSDLMPRLFPVIAESLSHVTTLPLYHGTDLSGFPVESIPDGSIWYAHHFWTGLCIALYGLYRRKRSYDPSNPADKTLGGILLSVFGWLFLWQNATSPFWGAAFSLVGVTVGVVAVVAFPEWRRYTLREYAGMARRAYETVASGVGRLRAGEYRDVFRSVVYVATYPLANPHRVALSVIRRLTGGRAFAFIGLLVAADDVYDHALPITSPIQHYYANGGHGRMAAATDVAVDVLTHAVNVLIDLLAALATLV